uniref:Tetratricopeptide repeat protein n=1 Tax=candidate division WOR-3 bacterium TaxID=2052148 RepID=A0A7V3UZY6_UNCW3
MRFKHRVSKDELKEDKFQQFVEKGAEFYYQNPRRFWIGVAVVLLVIAGVILLIQNRPKPVRSAEAELRLMDALSNLYQGKQDYAEMALKELAAKFPRDYAGIKAHYYLGTLYFSLQQQRLDEAKREFGIFLKKAKADPLLAPAAKIGIAACEEQAGNYQKAAEIYETVYRQYKGLPLSHEALLGAGRCYQLAGALDKAEKLYSEYLEKDKPTGVKADDIRVQLGYIRALKNKL